MVYPTLNYPPAKGFDARAQIPEDRASQALSTHPKALKQYVALALAERSPCNQESAVVVECGTQG